MEVRIVYLQLVCDIVGELEGGNKLWIGKVSSGEKLGFRLTRDSDI